MLLEFVAQDPLVQAIFVIVVGGGIVLAGAARWTFKTGRARANEEFADKRATAPETLAAHQAKYASDTVIGELNAKTALASLETKLRFEPKVIEHKKDD